jgi:hypothetical protein
MRRMTKFLGFAVLVLAAAAVLGAVVMVLWNAIVPALFTGAHSIDYLHALGLLVLSRILFGGFRGRGGWHGRRHFARWEAMTPEEREKFRRCGSWGRPGERASGEQVSGAP